MQLITFATLLSMQLTGSNNTPDAGHFNMLMTVGLLVLIGIVFAVGTLISMNHKLAEMLKHIKKQ